jgi:glycosyltransferase involved in cell wall biosynthesis
MKKIKKKNVRQKSNLLISQEQNQFITQKPFINIESKNPSKKNPKSQKTISKCLLFIFISENIFLLIYFITKKIITNPKKILSKKEIKILHREEALDSGLPFVKKCFDGILIKNITFKEKIPNPLITVVIPCYNCGQYIKSAIRSIQNQDMKEVEIIIVNDFSNDNNTLKIITDLKNEDARIEIFNNPKNMKLFYTRNIGVLKARGKYLITLDSDDVFLDSDVFDALYLSAEDGNFDIISHRIFEAFDKSDRNKIREHMYNGKENNLTIYQPELSCYAISRNGDIKGNDINIWGKLYRTSVYKSAVNYLGEERLSSDLMWEEDSAMLYIIMNVASSYKYIRKYCLFHNIHKVSSSTKLNHDDKAYGRLFKLELELELTKKECYNIPAKNLIEEQKKYVTTNDNRSIFYLKKVIKKIMYSEKIDDKYKIEIKNMYKDYLSINSNDNYNNKENITNKMR